MLRPGGLIGQNLTHQRRHLKGDAKDGEPYVIPPAVCRYDVHEPNLGFKEAVEHVLNVCPVVQVGPEFNANPSPFWTMCLRRTGHVRPFQAALDDRSPRTLKGRASVQGAMDGEVGQEPPLTLLGLVRTLTATATLPHLLGFLAVVVALFVTVGGTAGLETEAAAAFVGMGLAYAGVAMLAEQQSLRTWVVAEKGRPRWTLITVVLVPLALGSVCAGLILTVFDAAGLGSTLPVVLAGLFVAWSIGQGRSFRSAIVRWPTTALEPATRNPPGGMATVLRIGATGVLLLVVLVAQAALAGTSILSASVSLSDVILNQLAMAGGFAALVVVGEFISAGGRRQCQTDRWTSRMFTRWHVLALVFAAWHLGTAWRHITSTQPQVATAVEEIILMVVTVVMAVWSMTSKTTGSDLGLVRRSNALFWGLAFGYAYAGSVAMLSTVVQGVSGVLFLGHVVVALTLLMLLRTTGPLLANRHATAMSHAAMGARVEARISERSTDASEPMLHAEAEATTAAPEEADAPVVTVEPITSEAAEEDVIELLD